LKDGVIFSPPMDGIMFNGPQTETLGYEDYNEMMKDIDNIGYEDSLIERLLPLKELHERKVKAVENYLLETALKKEELPPEYSKEIIQWPMELVESPIIN